MEIKTAILGIFCAVGITAGAQETTHTAYMVADAHLDTQWNWDIQSTIRSHVWNTVNRNIALLNTYPDYIFNFEGGVKYAFMKEYYPREYELVKYWISDGRWHVSGASWEASDAIVPSAEAFIRNIMQGQQFYRNEFGVESTDIFLPDCFGFGWTLPTIANHCGLIGFSTQKLMWRQHPMHSRGRKTPFEFGVWQGIDGSQILCANGFNYTQRYDNIDLTEGLEQLKVYDHMPPEFIRYYGTGDVGGSPNIPSVLSVVKSLDGNGPVKIISSTSDQLFKKYWPLTDDHGLEIYDGELLMDVHGTGCYTSQTAMKLYNRQNETLGDAAERAAVAAALLDVSDYPGERLTDTWRRFLWHQFHDDLTGTSIPRAYEFSWNDELLSLKEFSALTANAVNGVTSLLDTRVKGTPVVLFNPLGFDNTDIVEVNVDAPYRPASAAVCDNNGRKVDAQIVDYNNGKATVVFEATVPSVGFAVYDLRLSGKAKKEATASPVESVENNLYSIRFDHNGDIASLYDKANSRELVKDGRAIRLALFTENKSYEWPAWEVIKETLDAEPQSITENVSVMLVEDGPVRKTVLIEKEHDGTKFRQYVRLYNGEQAGRIDFYNEVDWALTNALLKAEFPLAIANEKATYDLGIGAVERYNNSVTAYEVPAHYWANLTDADSDYGVTILNDCKYGWDKPDDNTLRLTLIHTPSVNNRYIYQSRQDQGLNTFTYSLLPHSGSLDRAAAAKHGERLNQRIKAYIADKHAGLLGKQYSTLTAKGDGLAVKALKRAEDGNGYIVRVYDTTGRGIDNGVIAVPFDITDAWCADGTEKNLSKASFAANTLAVNVKPNGISTYRVTFDEEKAYTAECCPIRLPFNRSCFTLNDFRHEGNFESGYTYPAELVPDTLAVDDIIFALEKYEPLNGVACEGEQIAIPEGYKRLYLLAAAATPAGRDIKAKVGVGDITSDIIVPSYTGFIGQWGHDGHTEGYLKPQRVGLTTTHRHSAEGDEPYEFGYMFVYGFDIPKGATSLTLPDNPEVVIFAATAANDPYPRLQEASPLFRTSIRSEGNGTEASTTPRVNLLKDAKITGYSGYCNKSEKPEFLVDGDIKTKWCDVSTLPNYVDFDLGESSTIKGWSMTNAAVENQGYVTVSCFLQGRNSESEEWQTLDFLNANKANFINRLLPGEVNMRYIRLLVTQPEQEGLGNATRIYELEVY